MNAPEFTCDAAEFAAKLGAITPFADTKKEAIPVLKCVRLEVAGAVLRLQCTDLDAEASTAVTCAGKTGATCVQAKPLLDFLRKLPKGAKVTMGPKAVKPGLPDFMAKSGRVQYSMFTLDASDFPETSPPHEPIRLDFIGGELARLLRTTAAAMSREATRYYLCGVYLHPVDGKLLAVATNSHLLIKCPSKMEAPEGLPGVIIPSATVKHLLRLSAETPDAIAWVARDKVTFEVGGVRVQSKLIDGTFPDYERVIPDSSQNATTATVDRNAMLETLDRINCVVGEGHRCANLDFGPGTLEATYSRDLTTAADSLDCTLKGGAMAIGFNAEYLRDIVGQMPVGKVDFVLTDPGSPGKILDAAGLDTYVLMPMRMGVRA